MAVMLIAVFLCVILQVDDVAAQSCEIRPNLTNLTLRNQLVRDIELHCQCLNMNGEVTETWWFFGNNLVSQNDSDRPFSIATTDPSRLIISGPYTDADEGVYTCGNTNPFSATSAIDMITLRAQTDPRGTTTCTIISTSLPGLITDGGPISIIIGTQNVIIYCICMRGSNNVGVGPTIWSRSNGQVTLTTTDGTDGNPYYRDNVPSPLIIPFFNATHADTYHCRSGSPGVTLDATITLTVQTQSCEIRPNLTVLTLRNPLARDIELHCQCIDMNGEVIETWWFLGNNVVSRSNSDRLFSTTTTNPTRLIISASYTGADAGVYTCGNTNPLSATSARDMITLNAQADPEGSTTCTIISTSLPGLSTDGGPVRIGTQNVIIYCICMRGSNNVGVGPTIWSRSNGQVTLTTTDETDGNPYYRNNVPSPLIIPSFNATHADTYRCRSGSFRVAGEKIDATITLTVQGLPAPTNVMARALTTRSVQVTWTLSTSPNVTGYLISYTTDASYISDGSVMVSGNSATSGTLNNLEEGTTYTITVQATTSNNIRSGNSNEVTVTTYTAAPSSPPQNVMLTSVNPASLMVSWQPPLAVDHNGMITGYVINYTEVDTNIMMSVNVSSETTQFTISVLVAYVNYSVTIAAMNTNGTGPFSNLTERTSGEDRPSEPESLNVVFINSNSLILQWRPPATPNGVIVLYSLKYNLTSLVVTNISNNTLTYAAGGLSSESVHMFQLTAYTGVGEGQPISIVVAIPPNTVLGLTILNESLTSSTLTLSWLEISLANSVLIHYTAFYFPLNGPYDRIIASNRRKRQSAQPGESIANFTTATTGALTNLNGSVTYRIEVAAVVVLNVNGQVVTGDRSIATVITTKEGVPTPPRNLCAMVTRNDVILTWSRPDPPNGLIVQYNVSYINPNTQDSNITIVQMVNGGDSTLSLTWTDLSQGRYNFTVIASTAKGLGEAAVLRETITFGTNCTCDSYSNDNNGIIITLATVLTIAVIGLVMSIVINVFLVVQRKQSRYDVDLSNVRYSDVKQSGNITESISKCDESSEPDYEAVDTEPNTKPDQDIKMDVNPAYGSDVKMVANPAYEVTN